MSTKFEQLLDYIVNEEMDKANELFHEIVVEKSREIYENLIAEESAENDKDKNPEEESGKEAADESMQPTDEESVDETMDEMMGEPIEDSYELEGDEGDDEMGADDGMGEPGDKTDDLLGDVEADGEPSEEEAIMDIKDAIAELEAAFADLQAAKGGDMGGMDDMGADAMGDEEDEEDDEEDEEDEEYYQEETMGLREYRETVAKPSGDVAGANTGEKMSAAGATKSPISSGSGKPTSSATAIHAKSNGANEDGTKPHGKVGGLVKQGGKFVDGKTHNVDNVTSGVKTLSKVSKPADAEGHAAGAGTGENSVKGATNTKSLLKHVK